MLQQPSPKDPTNQAFESASEPIRHLLIGSPQVVRRTIYQLHTLRYAEVGLWTHPIAIPNNQVIITPNQGEVMSLLVKLMQLK